jgi:nucleoside-diphosphate-sugar epimerase
VTRVLVTGSGGFIGRRTLEPLAERGYDVVRNDADLLVPGEPERLIGDVRPTHLLHLAWYAEHGKFWTSPENVRWVEASLALLRAFADAGGRRAVIAGTCAEYDWSAGEGLFAEDAALGPATLYGAAKNGLRAVAAAFAAEAGFELAWGRVFFLYGADEAPGRLFASVARSLLAGEPARTSSGEQLRDFLHADDVGAAFAALTASVVTGAVNIASGEAVAVRDVVAEIARAAGRLDLLELGALPQRPGEPPRIVADVRRLRDEVGFTPAFGLAEGVAAAVEQLRARERPR